MFSPCSHGLPAGAPVSPTIRTCMLGLSQSAPLTEGLAQNLELVPGRHAVAAHCSSGTG